MRNEEFGPGYGRTTITVPHELKRRMKMVAVAVNWSAVACDAFRQKLDEIAPQVEIDSIEDAVARMKQLRKMSGQSSGAVTDATSYSDGAERGKSWAMSFATPEQLERLQELREALHKDDWADLFANRRGLAEVGLTVLGDERAGKKPRKRPRSPANEIRIEGGKKKAGYIFWMTAIGDVNKRPDHPDFFRGFAEGALDVWKEIKKQL